VIHNGLKFITQNAAVHKQPLHSAGIPELWIDGQLAILLSDECFQADLRVVERKELRAYT